MSLKGHLSGTFHSANAPIASDEEAVIVSDGVYSILQAQTAAQREAHYAIRHDVYCEEKGWLDRTTGRVEKDAYDDQPSTLPFLVRHDQSGIIIGAFRLIIPNDPRELPGVRLSGQDDLIPHSALPRAQKHSAPDIIAVLCEQIEEGWPILQEMAPASQCLELSRLCLSQKRLREARKATGEKITHSPLAIMCTMPFAIVEATNLNPSGFLMLHIATNDVNEKLEECGLHPCVTGTEFLHHQNMALRICNAGQVDWSKLARLIQYAKDRFNIEKDFEREYQKDKLMQFGFAMAGLHFKDGRLVRYQDINDILKPPEGPL